MRVRLGIRIAVVVAAASVACSSGHKDGILLDIEAAANLDGAAITSLAVTVDTRTQVNAPTTLPGSLGIRTSAGSHHIVVYGPAASPIARWEGAVVAVSSGTAPSIRVLLEAIVTSALVDGGGGVFAGTGGNADAASAGGKLRGAKSRRQDARGTLESLALPAGDGALPDDYVVVKLDIDNLDIEDALVDQILKNPALAGLIDEMYSQRHAPTDYTKVTYKLFRELRTKGIRMHAWP
jgi:hypothetical protein